MKTKVERLISKIDLMILGLVLEKPMHGYEINQIIGSEEMQSWLDISRTSVYYALSRLKKQGFITEVVEKQHNKPDRSIFRITEAGRELFFNSLSQSLAEQERVFLEYNIGLFFINKLTKERAVEVLEKRKRFLKKWRSTLNEHLKVTGNGQEHPSTLRAVIDHTLSFAESEVSWLDSFIESVTGAPLEGGINSIFSLGGSLQEVQLADVIRMIASGERAGTLSLEHGPESITITFEKGEICYVAGSSGLFSKEDMGYLEEGTIPDYVLRAFNWPEGSFTFTPDKIVDEGGFALKASSCELIFAGCRLVDDWSRIRKVVPSSSTIYELSEGRKNPLEKVGLNPEEKSVLEQINGIRSIERLAEVTSMSIFDVSRVLYSFVICGLVTTTNKERAELFDFLKAFSDALFERLDAIKAEKMAKTIEEGLNSLAEKTGMPFSLDNFKLVDGSNMPKDFKEFINLVKGFYTAQIDAIQAQLGSRFTGHVLESIIGQLTPEMYDIYTRHGFNNIDKRHRKG